MPQLPSLQRIIQEAGRVAGRFPLTLLCAAAGCLAGFQVVTYFSGEANQPDWTFPLLSAGLLGLPLTLALTLAAERYRWPAAGRWLTQANAMALLEGWYALVPALPGLVWNLSISRIAAAIPFSKNDAGAVQCWWVAAYAV